MPKSYELISNSNVNSGGKPDANLANDSNHLGGIPAEDYATKKYVQDYHDGKESNLKNYIDRQDNAKLDEAKEYANSLVRNQDFSDFAKDTDIQALDDKLSKKIEECHTNCETRINEVVKDVNANFDTVTKSIEDINTNIDQIEQNITNMNTNINEIEENITNMNTNINGDISGLEEKYDELFQSVSDGKSKIAGAITDKGVPTSATDTFSNMASNIRKIQTGGEGLDTSDATATENDLLKGTTAYVKGKKIYGKLAIYKENDDFTMVNPDNPTPSYVGAELIYGTRKDELQISVVNVVESGDIFDITDDRRFLMKYDAENGKLLTYRRGDDGGYSRYVNQHGELLTPEYLLSDLEIQYLSDLDLKSIKFSAMENGYSCKVALQFAKKADSVNENARKGYCYIFKFSTSSGKLIYKDTDYTVEIGDKVIDSIEYGKWVLETEDYNEETQYSLEDIVWSSYDSTLIFVQNCSSRSIFKIYTLNDDNFVTKKNMELRDTITEISLNGWGFNIGIANNNKLLYYTIGYNNKIKVYDNKFHSLGVYDFNDAIGDYTPSVGSKTFSLESISEDGLYILANSSSTTLVIYKLIVDYTNRGISIEKIFEKSNSRGELVIYPHFTRDNHFIIAGNYIYKFTAEDDVINLEEYSTEYSFSSVSSVNKTHYIVTKNGLKYLASTIIDPTVVIGIRYNGEMYYREYMPSGILEATSGDVTSGKTFIGHKGIIEQGSREEV